jgi:hypothetical protein
MSSLVQEKSNSVIAIMEHSLGIPRETVVSKFEVYSTHIPVMTSMCECKSVTGIEAEHQGVLTAFAMIWVVCIYDAFRLWVGAGIAQSV